MCRFFKVIKMCQLLKMDSKTKHFFVSQTNQKLLYKYIIKRVWELGNGNQVFQIGSMNNNGIMIDPYFKNIIDTNAAFFIENVQGKPRTMDEKSYILNCNRKFVEYCSNQISQDIIAYLQGSGSARQQLGDSHDDDQTELIADVLDDWNDDPLDPPIAAADEDGSDLDERLDRLERERSRELNPIHRTGKISGMKRKALSQQSVISAKNLNIRPQAKKTSTSLKSKKNVQFEESSSSDSSESEDYSDSEQEQDFQSRVNSIVARRATDIGNSDTGSGSDSEDAKPQQRTASAAATAQPKKRTIVMRKGKKTVATEKEPTVVTTQQDDLQSENREPAKTKPNAKPKQKHSETTKKTIVNIDTRSFFSENSQQQELSEYKIPFAFRNVKQFRLVSAEIPKTGYNITKFNNRLYFEEEEGKLLQASVEPGYYATFDSLKRAIEEQMKLVGNGLYSISEDSRTHIVKVTASSNPAASHGVHLFAIDWTKENTLVDILGFSRAKQQGSLSYKGSRCYSLRGDPYILLQIPEIGARFSDNKTFSKIVLDVPEGEIKYYQPQDDSIAFPHLKTFQEITIRFRGVNDRMYNFHDQHHSLTFEITTSV